jgi:hypothetical protein
MSLDDVGQLLREFGHTSSAQTLGAVNMVDHCPPKVLTDFDRLRGIFVFALHLRDESGLRTYMWESSKFARRCSWTHQLFSQLTVPKVAVSAAYFQLQLRRFVVKHTRCRIILGTCAKSSHQGNLASPRQVRWLCATTQASLRS